MAPRQQASRSVWRDRSPTHMHARPRLGRTWENARECGGRRGQSLPAPKARYSYRLQEHLLLALRRGTTTQSKPSKQLRIRQGWQKGTADGQTLYHHLAPIVARTQSLASRAAHGPGSYPQFINPPNPSIHQSITSRGPALLERKTRQTLLHPPVSLSVCPFVC
jgi:hypothetical protein